MKLELKELRAVNINDLEWEETRFDNNWIKVLSFKDNVNFELQKFGKGCHTFPHKHGFWQLRYILEGEFIVNGYKHGPGTMIDFPEDTMYEVTSPDGGVWIVVQMPGPKSGEAPTDPTGMVYGKASKKNQ